MPTVILDSTSIVRSDWYLRGPACRVALHMSRADSRVTVVVPEIVIREVVGRYAEEVRNLRATFDETTSKLAGLGVLKYQPPEVDTEQAIRDYEAYLRSTLESAGVSSPIPPHDLDILELVDKAIWRRKPFNKSGSGFRDALIWLSVVDCVRSSSQGPITFVTKDAAAFCDDKAPGVLARDLKEELDAIGPTSVLLCESIHRWLVGQGIQDPVLTLAVTE